jgi:hypothetical protein
MRYDAPCSYCLTGGYYAQDDVILTYTNSNLLLIQGLATEHVCTL